MNKNINVVCYGEILWDNMPDQRRVGGAPLNVCYHLIKNGIKSQIVSQVGDDTDGQDLMEAMESMGVDTSYVRTSQYPTSRVEVTILADGSADYEIVEHVAWDHIDVDDTVTARIQDADAFVFGSLSARNPLSRQTLFTYLAHTRCAVFDINLRPPFYDRELVLDLIENCHILKINNKELEVLAAWIGFNASSEDGMLENLLQLFPNVQEILLTKGAQGARYYGRENDIVVPAPHIKLVDTVGSGDSFLAAFLAQKLQGKTIQEAMAYAVSLSAYIATQSGACPTYTEKTITEFNNHIRDK